MRGLALPIAVTALGCADPGIRVPATERAPVAARADRFGPYCAVELRARSVAGQPRRRRRPRRRLLALDCWEWDGAVTVDADDRSEWALRIDVRCRDDSRKAIDGSFRGRKM